MNGAAEALAVRSSLIFRERLISFSAVHRALQVGSRKITYISSEDTHYQETIPMKQTWHLPLRISHRGGRGQDFIDPFLFDNPSRDNGWSGYFTRRNSTQGGDR